MPKALKTPCSVPSCANIATSAGRCSEHRRKPWRRTYDRHVSKSWQQIRLRVLARDNYTCSYCHGPATEVDHIVGRAKGGADTEENCVACCHRCNQEKAKQEAADGRRASPKPAPATEREGTVTF